MESRVPVIDPGKTFPACWKSGDPVASHAFNALSLLFPSAEAFFVSVVREVAAKVDLPHQGRLTRSVVEFIAQETTHHDVHVWYNRNLSMQGYENRAATLVRILQRQSRRDFGALSRLAIVCAYEHYTASLGAFLLSSPDVLDGADSDLRLVWGWHSAEETEHKSVCFDLYRHAGGSESRRIAFYAAVTLTFGVMFLVSFVGLLARDGLLRPSQVASTLRSAGRFFLGGRGVLCYLGRRSIGYARPGFHPTDNRDEPLLIGWFASNKDRLVPARANKALNPTGQKLRFRPAG